ncbi:LysR family transcriptional regulator [Pantoea cypripedii]|uniref:LysR family transcriptional regulator n=1 Tax=Pantoea cypripedii TaxID=55209 RepID=UPI00286F375B|nr:LysR family transcriptional regulator [Pantoea cypripedii]
MQPLPNLKLLQVFASVVENQGYSRAQQALNMTTPAISAYMSELETQLGFILCQRGRGGFSLTSKGEQFYRYSQQMLATLAGWQEQVETLKSAQGGTFSLGVVDATVTDNTLDLPAAIARFNQRFPAVFFNLSVRDPNELQQQLLEDRLDLAIGHFPLRASNLVTIPLYEEQHWLYCSPQHPLAQGAPDMRTVQQTGMVTRGYWNQQELNKRGFRQSNASVESIEAQLTLILSGRFIGYLPEHYARSWEQQGALCRLLPQHFQFRAPFSFAFRRGRARETLIRAMREILNPARKNSSES